MKKNFYSYYVFENYMVENDDEDIMLNIGAYILFLFMYLVTKKVFTYNNQK